MNDLSITGSQSTPTIFADGATGTLTMSGDSYPENSFELFGPVFAWIEQYLSESEETLQLELTLLYLNTSSIKAVMEIFDMLQGAHDDGRKVTVNWYYDHRNERVGELAEEFKEDCTFPFSVIARP